jgi:hypothetical protein
MSGYESVSRDDVARPNKQEDAKVAGVLAACAVVGAGVLTFFGLAIFAAANPALASTALKIPMSGIKAFAGVGIAVGVVSTVVVALGVGFVCGTAPFVNALARRS